MANERELLFGLLALRDEYVTGSQLVAAFSEWLVDRARPLAEVLAAKGGIAAEDVADLNKQVERRLRKNGGDAAKSLDGLPLAESVRQGLSGLGDGALSLQMVASAGPYDSYTHIAAGRLEWVERNKLRGGVGTVSLVRDTRLRRIVAFKEIRDDRLHLSSIRERFVFEAEVTGALEHPGIPPVYDLGQHADGKPFYSMRFVEGKNLAVWIKTFHARSDLKWNGEGLLEMRRLLRRFLAVCDTMQYAHDRGVIHRDLKPSNILLGDYGETMVIDWGMARVVGPVGTSKEMGQEAETVIGLSLDTAPIPGAPLDEGEFPVVETRPDRDAAFLPEDFSDRGQDTSPGKFGGTPEYASPEQASMGQKPVARPSDIYSLCAVLFHVVTGRPAVEGTSVEMVLAVQKGGLPGPRDVAAEVPEGLDRIVRQGMSSDPSDRFGEVRELRANLANWLGEQEAAERDVVLRQVAERRYDVAMRAFGKLVFEVQDELEKLPAAGPVRKRVLTDVVSAIRELSETSGQGSGTRLEATGLLRLGDLLLNFDGQALKARDLYRRAHETLERLAQESPGDAEAGRDVSVSYNKLGDVTLRLGQAEQALGYYRQGLEIGERLAQGSPGDAQAQRDVSVSYNKLGDVTLQLGEAEEALGYFKQGLEIRERLAKESPGDAQAQRDVSVSYNKLGDVTLQLGEAEEALGYYQQGLEIRERLAQGSPGDAQAQRDVSVSYNKLGDVTLQLGEAEEALGYFKQGLEIRERLAKESPGDAQAQRDVSVSYNKLGDVTLQLGEAEEALGYYRKDLEIAERLARESPGDAQAQRDVSISYEKLALVLKEQNRYGDAIQYAEKALGVSRKLAEAAENDASAQRTTMIHRRQFGQLRQLNAQYAEAIVEYRAGIEIVERMIERKQNVEETDQLKKRLEELISRCELLTFVTGDVAAFDGLDEKTRPNAWAMRATEFARLGRVAEALEAAERLAKLEPLTVESRYNTACAFSLVYGAKRKGMPQEGPMEPEVEGLAVRALESLREAVKLGFDKVEQLEKNPDFAAIREREEFREVVKGLKEGKTKE
jgi:eukaryotic-like serine/threonine-protein kinase